MSKRGSDILRGQPTELNDPAPAGVTFVSPNEFTPPPSAPPAIGDPPPPPPSIPGDPPSPAPPIPNQLDAAATLILSHMRTLEPAWDAKIQALLDERHFSDRQALMSLAAYTLDSDQHMQIPGDHPAFAPNFIPAGSTAKCPVCQKDYTLLYPGMPFCGNACAAIGRAEKRAA